MKRMKGIVLALVLLGSLASAQKIKVIVDQDARGPGTSDQQAILVFLQSEKFDVLGITTVSGDQWVKEETQHTLRMLEIANRTDVPVYQGAVYPLLNSKEETERWEALYGKFEYKGCWTDFEANRSTKFREPYHEPDVVPAMPEGEPHLEAHSGTAAEFIVQMVHKYPGEVVLWAGGPLTNYALALKLDPAVATLAKEFVLMGGGLYADKGAIGIAERLFVCWVTLACIVNAYCDYDATSFEAAQHITEHSRHLICPRSANSCIQHALPDPRDEPIAPEA